MSVQKYRANPLAKNFYLLGAVRVLYSADHRVRHDEVDERQAVAQALAVVCRDILFGDDDQVSETDSWSTCPVCLVAQGSFRTYDLSDWPVFRDWIEGSEAFFGGLVG
jgi:hypothetical protein